MLILAAMLQLLPLQNISGGQGIHCYGSPLRIGLDRLPSADGNRPGPILNAEVFLDRQTSAPVAYVYHTYRGSYVQFTKAATADELYLWREKPVAPDAVVPLSADHLVGAEQDILMHGRVLVGCLSHVINWSE